jgi:hypothetical protein
VQDPRRFPGAGVRQAQNTQGKALGALGGQHRLDRAGWLARKPQRLDDGQLLDGRQFLFGKRAMRSRQGHFQQPAGGEHADAEDLVIG